MRVTGQFASEDSLRAINLRVNNRFFRLSDVATITRGYTDPPASLFRFNGQDAIGLAVGMKPNANLLEFGKALDHKMEEVKGELPVGVGRHAQPPKGRRIFQPGQELELAKLHGLKAGCRRKQ